MSRCGCCCLSCCHPRRGSAVAVAVVVAVAHLLSSRRDLLLPCLCSCSCLAAAFLAIILPRSGRICFSPFASRFPQENSIPVAHFQPPKNDPKSTAFHHTIHHKITTKNHTKTPTFSKTPLKNAQKTAKPRISPGPHFFSANGQINTFRPCRRHADVRRRPLPSSRECRRSSPQWSASTQRSKPRSAEQSASPS